MKTVFSFLNTGVFNKFKIMTQNLNDKKNLFWDKNKFAVMWFFLQQQRCIGVMYEQQICSKPSLFNHSPRTT